MNFSRRAMQLATIGWALYLILTLSAFALHMHSSHEGSHGRAPCALCLAHDVTGAVAAVAVFVFAAPPLCWRLQLWLMRSQSAFVASIEGADNSRGPPAKVFLLNQIEFNKRHFP